MIVDRLGNRSVDAYVPARVRQALEYLRVADLATIPLGRHDLDGDHLFALVQEYTTRPSVECAWEAHRRYIDVQHVVLGAERMGHETLERSGERVPYDPDHDVTLFYPGTQFVTLTAGMIAIFGPNDVHSPGGAVDDPRPVRKVVMKAAIEKGPRA